jgi:hypothetical protein
VCVSFTYLPPLHPNQGRIQGGVQGFRTPLQQKKGKERKKKGRKEEKEREVEKDYL